ncbi:asparagine synthase-related protein [Halocatena salina]|uniref:Asparagine synthase-related protein n=1 Tax=Halocatena salina TaxID=2934340 RepID=A0A8U0A2Q8_9EURY|nr:asparagine synthase-related protein [Halocatena salina]UPM42267.1 asparagine synthase-related protein [Halocatena salina]
MVGLCSVIGAGSLPDAMANAIGWDDAEASITYRDDRFELRASLHTLLAGEQPAVAGEDVLIWVWGDVYGYGSEGNYAPRNGPPDGSAAFCARLYELFGMRFVEGLNGNFALVVYDQATKELSLVTDRFATRPLYYARPTEETLLVSSQSQSLVSHPDLDPEFELPYLYEYLELRRVFGVETPIKGVRQLPPGSIVSIDLDDLEMTTETYWSPSHDPIDKPFSYFRDRFTETIQQVFEEWTDDDLSYGLLLSGGSDSRLALGAIDQPVTAFHNADWMSREAKTAKRSAQATGNTFELLERDPEYDAQLLDCAPPLSNFSGWFDQAYFLGFHEEIAEEVDVLVSGLYADMLLGGGPLETRTLSLNSLGNLTLPIAQSIDSIDEYVSAQVNEAVEPLPYFSGIDDQSLSSIIRSNIHADDEGVVSHGVRYDSLRDLALYGSFYPIGADTDAIFSESLAHMRPYRTPFLDNRIVDLQQRIPVKYFLRRNFVNEAITEIEPTLAEIPHAHTGVPVKYHFPIDYLGKNIHGFWWKHIADDDVPEPHLDHTPWPNRTELIRTQSFTTETLRTHESTLAALPFLDLEGAWECYQDHLDGADNTPILYSLLTLLKTNVTDAVYTANDDTNTDANPDSVIEPSSTTPEG